MLDRINSRLAALATTVALALSVLVGSAQTATAAGLSYVWNDYSNAAAVYSLPHTGTIVHHYARNGTKFRMSCWLDNQQRRWFYGQIHDTGSWVYVEARWVGSQITVGRC